MEKGIDLQGHFLDLIFDYNLQSWSSIFDAFATESWKVILMGPNSSVFRWVTTVPGTNTRTFMSMGSVENEPLVN